MTENGADLNTAPPSRLCLRLDNGTRIGPARLLGSDQDAQIVRLDYADGFSKGIVSDEDLVRISEIAGRLEAQKRALATGPSAKPPVAVSKDQKRKRIPKAQPEVPEPWTQKGMRVLDEVQRKPNADWFSEPVKPTAGFAPDYFTIISQPMDLGTVKERLRNGHYSTVQEFEADLDLIWSNAMRYNGENVPVGKAAAALRKATNAALRSSGLTGAAGGDRSKRANAGTSSAKFDPEQEYSQDSRQRSRGGGGGGGARGAHATTAASKPKAPAPKSKGKGGGAAATQTTWAQVKPAVMAALEQMTAADDHYEALLMQVTDLLQAYLGEDDELDLELVPPGKGMELYNLLAANGLIGGAAAPAAQGPRVTAGMDVDDEETDIE